MCSTTGRVTTVRIGDVQPGEIARDEGRLSRRDPSGTSPVQIGHHEGKTPPNENRLQLTAARRLIPLANTEKNTRPLAVIIYKGGTERGQG